MKNLFALALASTALASSAHAAEVTLYYNFAEVRDTVTLSGGRFDWVPPADLGQFLVPGSLELEYPELFNMTLLPPSENLLKAFEGREVSLRLADGSVVKAKVIRAEIGLFEVAGQYIQASPSQVIYPSLDGVRFAPTYSWQFGGAGGNAALTYLTRGLGWSPRYTLTVKNNDAALNAWADVRNASSLEVSAPNATLIAGQVNIAANDDGFERSQAAFAPAQARADESVQATGELGGLQTFRYAKPITLAPKTTTSLPFVNTKASLERILEYRGGFNPSPKITVPLARIYSIKTDSDLPGGVVTVREDNRVVGQARIGDSPKAENVDMNLGADFDLRLTRTAQTLERTQKIARYKVNFSLVNTKTRAVTVRLSESLGGNFTLDQTVLPGLKRTEDGFSAQATLQPNQRLEASYTITYRY
jgi:hypothetical protein